MQPGCLECRLRHSAAQMRLIHSIMKTPVNTRQGSRIKRAPGAALGRRVCHAGQYIEAMPTPALARPMTAPSQCEVCHQWATNALCADCITRFAPAVTRCACCGLRLGLAAPACGECLRMPPPFERTHCLADYGFPWDALITRFKFESAVELAGELARRLHAALPADEPDAPTLVLPVPLSPRRLAERGYNQAWELARRVARLRGVPARADVLLRPGETAHQAELDRTARQHNLRNAFMVDPRQRAAVQGRRVALVDDVMTTGATVREAATALRRAGAAAVHVWVLARTPDT